MLRRIDTAIDQSESVRDPHTQRALNDLVEAWIQEHGFGYGVSLGTAVDRAYAEACQKYQGAPDPMCHPEEFATFCHRRGIPVLREAGSDDMTPSTNGVHHRNDTPSPDEPIGTTNLTTRGDLAEIMAFRAKTDPQH